ncbi:MAG: hypothetical protein ISQ06_00515 [Planctomycetaceae bacterium]|nr:hypothetical protein [Planctomycetaceae bacterium]
MDRRITPSVAPAGGVDTGRCGFHAGGFVWLFPLGACGVEALQKWFRDGWVLKLKVSTASCTAPAQIHPAESAASSTANDETAWQSCECSFHHDERA